jgi:carboxylesterase type B
MSSPTFQNSGTANIELYDQILALDWIQMYILSRGDGERVTMVNEFAKQEVL